ncbi:hypothetical protein Trydic_g6709 [Trypoxylus dichotomus]
MNSVFLKIAVVDKSSSWCTQIVPFMDTITNVHPVIVSRTPGSFRAWLAPYGNRNLIQKNPQQVYNSHLIYHVQFHDENRASNNFLKKNAMPSLFLAVPTVERRKNVLDHEYCRSMAETTAVTLDSDEVDTSTCNMSNKSNPGEAMVWESFCVVATKVPTSRNCCKTTVRELRDHQYCRSLAGSSAAALICDGVG